LIEESQQAIIETLKKLDKNIRSGKLEDKETYIEKILKNII